MDTIFQLNSPDHDLYGPRGVPVQQNSIHPAQMRDGSVTCQSIRLDAHNRKKTNINKKRKVIDECDNQRWTIIRVRKIVPGHLCQFFPILEIHFSDIIPLVFYVYMNN